MGTILTRNKTDTTDRFCTKLFDLLLCILYPKIKRGSTSILVHISETTSKNDQERVEEIGMASFGFEQVFGDR